MKITSVFLTTHNIVGKSIMEWPAASPDLNPIENYWALIKPEVYKTGRQFNNLESLWDEICRATLKLPETIGKLTKSVDNRLVAILQCRGKYVNH